MKSASEVWIEPDCTTGRGAVVKCSFGLQSELDRIEAGLKSGTAFEEGSLLVARS